jgi:hypothetical protein
VPSAFSERIPLRSCGATAKIKAASAQAGSSMWRLGIKGSRSVIQNTDFGVGNLTLDTTLADMNPMLEFSAQRVSITYQGIDFPDT